MKSMHGQMAFDRADRYTEDGKMKCRKGKECNGRCIPKGHECNADRAADNWRSSPDAAGVQGSDEHRQNTRNALIVGAGILGVAGAGMAYQGAKKELNRRASALKREKEATAREEQALRDLRKLNEIDPLQQIKRGIQSERVNATIGKLAKNEAARRREGVPGILPKLPLKGGQIVKYKAKEA